MATMQRQPVLGPPPGSMTSTLPLLQPDLDLNETTFFAVYCFIKNFVGAANNTSAIIDKKIEQAMDLVKSHLMYTVREEVKVLKGRIAELLNRISALEMENNFLRANATPEILNALQNRPRPTCSQWGKPNVGASGSGPSTK